MPKRNYAERAGELTGKPASNKNVERDKAIKLANLLEGIDFPATKKEIVEHINASSPRGRINDILEAVSKNLDDRTRYENAYKVELAAGLVEQAQKPYVRDKALNRANSERIDEKIRPDPYSGHEKIGPASIKDVSPNTPPGEEY